MPPLSMFVGRQWLRWISNHLPDRGCAYGRSQCRSSPATVPQLTATAVTSTSKFETLSSSMLVQIDSNWFRQSLVESQCHTNRNKFQAFVTIWPSSQADCIDCTAIFYEHKSFDSLGFVFFWFEGNSFQLHCL